MASSPMPQPCAPIQISEFFTEDRRFSGVYFLYYCGVMVYVGQSRTIQWRIDEHLTEGVKRFDAIAFLCCPLNRLNAIEQHYIRRFAPKYNQCALTKRVRLEGSWSQPEKIPKPSKPRWSKQRKAAARAARNEQPSRL